MWVMPIRPKMTLAIFGGPSFYSVKQTIVRDYDFNQSYSYDDVTLTRVVTEDEPRPGDDYLGKVCAAWENEAVKAEATAKRVVRARIGVVLGKDGGALQTMLNPPGVPFSPF